MAGAAPRPSRQERTPARRRCAAGCGSPTGACSAASCGLATPGAAARDAARAVRRARGADAGYPAARRQGARSTGGPTPDHYLPGGAGGRTALAPAAARARRADRSRRVRVRAVRRRAARGGVRRRRAATGPHGSKDAVAHTRFLWLDVDRPDRLPALWDFLAERPCQLLCECGGSGGVHCYWKLAEPLPAERVDERDRRGGRADRAREPADDPRARLRRGRHPERRRPPCADRSSVMRLAGSVNGKTRRVGTDRRGRLRPRALPGRAAGRRPARSGRPHHARRPRRAGTSGDPYRRISRRPSTSRSSPGRRADATGSCPAPTPRTMTTTRRARSASRARSRWCCQGRCGAAGAIYDLASVVLGGPWGHELRDDAFRRARAYVLDVYGELTNTNHGPATAGPVKGADDETEQRRAGDDGRASGDTRGRPAVYAGGGGGALASRGQARAAGAQARGRAGRGRAHRRRRRRGRRAARATRTAALPERQRARSGQPARPGRRAGAAEGAKT